ncbi:argininosuccinate lyase [Haloarcula marismortui ATCC 43049]|uniref:Argininosuccinate lyase n=2 Tax=Haloarcula marismortui (strain ATCC 43049 / DSM 3752 / JCM 8966 / VKM B-1809) TaxID=272569 RepID=ARLY_HALMA|nr:argininosuccinate lyase [Haloarcula marismortui]Q5UZ47.1 RecName: Full=Argininosuccinate lyase; Short=ASAL; AltName: Full=Arginosuccinase [Haloarcula marismortui ATCC 43049]AAV47456.1 argininosuccinate lyase [Haloarcula marismortui ATCC 43049]QCP92160.1 argininosuccinate lyase [Haloarcula marismortui ATCC 43049]
MSDGEDHETANADDRDETVVRRDRFAGGPARSFLSSLSDDERIFAADLAVDRAHVVMLAEREIIDRETAGDVLAALADVEDAGHDALPDGEDVHEAIESAVIERVGPDGGKMHTARSRNDEVAACIRYRLREDILDLIETVVGAREQLIEVARAEDGTVMPGYTHLQPAQPTTVAHWVLSYEQALQRDTGRLLDAYERVNQNPLGSAAFAGTPFDVDRERTAALLGFDSVAENSMDASATRDFLVETTSAVATLATTLSGLAEDVVVMASKGHVALDDDYASTSSIMPQKKNPDTLELVRGRTGDAVAGLNGLLTNLKGQPRAYNRDLQRAGRHAWDAIDSVTESVEVAAGAVATADWPAETLEVAATDGFATATGVADLLAMAGVPFRTAHEVVAEAAAGLGPEEDAPDYEALSGLAEDVLGEPLSTYVDRDALEAALDPTESVAMRDSRGGPAPDAVAEQVSVAVDALAADREVLADRRQAVSQAADRRQTEVDRYV